MPTIKKAYSKITSAFRPTISQPHRPKSEPTMEKPLTAESAAEILIQVSPKIAQGYLALGIIYKRQNMLLAARDVFKRGLSCVPTSDAQHSQLQMEMKIVSATLYRRNHQLFYLAPNEIWSTVFGFLNDRDLWQCAGVSSLWCDTILDDPGFLFRKRELVNGVWTHYNKGQLQELNLFGYILEPGMLRHVLKILLLWTNNGFKKLTFRHQDFVLKDVELLLQVLRSINPPFNHLNFDGCVIPIQCIVPILESCPSMSFAKFRLTDLDDSGPSPDFQGVSASSLTHLQLTCFSTHRFQCHEPDDAAMRATLTDIFKRCPNLIHLVLGFKSSAYLNDSVTQALEHCTQLKNLAILDHKHVDAPAKVFDIGWDEPNTEPVQSENSSTTYGLRKFIYYGDSYLYIQPIFDKALMSLERLTLRYDGSSITFNTLSSIATCGLPSLRQISILTNLGVTKPLPPITSALTVLFSSCPLLETIVVDFGTFRGTANLLLNSNEELLMAIAKNCRFLRRLEMNGRYRYSGKTMIDFAAAVGPNFTNLIIDMDRTKALALVQRLTTLVCFGFAHDDDEYAYPAGLPRYSPISLSDKEAIGQILTARGGDLL